MLLIKVRYVLLLALCIVTPASPQSPFTALSASDFGTRRLHGFDFGDLAFGQPSATDFTDIEATGANLLRVFFEVERSTGSDRYQVTAQNLANLDRYVLEAERRRLWVIIAFHPPFADKEEKGDLWRNANLSESYVAEVQRIAAHFEGRAVIGGVDILNEPVPPGASFLARQNRWLILAEQLARAIQSVNPHVPIIVQPAPDALSVAFKTLVPLDLPNIVYSVHSYFPMALTHQHVMTEYRDSISYGNLGSDPNQWNKEMLSGSLQPVRDFATRFHKPVYVGEFSCARWAPNNSAKKYIADSVAIFEEAHWPWTYHDFRGWNGWDSEVGSPDRDNQNRSGTAPVFEVLKDAMLNTNAGSRR